MQRTGRLLAGGTALVCGTFLTFVAQGDPPIEDRIPTLDDPVVYENEFGTYMTRAEIEARVADGKAPGIVKSVNWEHPLIKGASQAFGYDPDTGEQVGVGASRSAMSYYDHLKVYDLDDYNDWGRKRWYYEHLHDFNYEREISKIEREEAKLEAQRAATDVAALLRNKCASCHTAEQAPDLSSSSDDTLLEEAKKHVRTWSVESSDLLTRARGESDHEAVLSAEGEDYAQLLAWIQGSAPTDAISQSKYRRDKRKLERERSEAEETNALGAEGRQQKMDEIDFAVAKANYENFIKTLLGEYRDYPFMIQTKLEILAKHTPVNKAGAQTAPADADFLFDSLTGDGYARLKWLMAKVYEARERKLNPNPSRYNYPWGETGHHCNRVDNAVKPWTHAEMRYIFAEWLQGDPKPFNIDDYEAGLAQFIEDNCDPSPDGPDLGYSYDFRGHKNWKANWMECNSFIWNSRDAAQVLLAQADDEVPLDLTYYEHPFASRYKETKELMGAYVYYPSEHHQHMRKASERGGGPHLYVDNEDRNGDGVAEYRLFPDVQGSGDIGLESQALSANRVYAGTITDTVVATFSPEAFRSTPDWGFGQTFLVNGSTREGFATEGVFTEADSDEDATFKLRMSRINQALDRHTNWGPTHMFSPAAYRLNKRHAVRGAYSPIVAMSYEISKSHSFAVGNYPATHPKDKGHVKWMFLVKFRTENYYDERDLKAGLTPVWDAEYINESSMSNDYYHERALDKFGWIPASDMHTAAYLAEADAEDYYNPGVSSTPTGPGIIDHLGDE